MRMDGRKRMNQVENPMKIDAGRSISKTRLEDRESGQTTVIAALMLGTFLMGFVALGTDVAHFYQQKRQVQAATDAAVLAAAEEAGNSTAQTAAAQAMVQMYGLNTSGLNLVLTGPTSGNYAGNNQYVEVQLTEAVPTIFLGAFNHRSNVNVSARAVASLGQTSPTCVCLEGTSGTNLNMNNGSQLTMTSCGIMLNSNSSNAASLQGGAHVNTASIGSISTNWYPNNVGNGAQISSNTRIIQGISTSCSPSLPPVPTYSSSQCTSDPAPTQNGGSAFSVGPGSTLGNTQYGNLICYNGLTVGDNGKKVNLNPGIYVINGGTLHFESGYNNVSNTGGNGVFFYLTNNANLVIDNGANANLTAPTSGAYDGTLIFQDPTDTQAVSVQGGSKLNIGGDMFAPSAALMLGNGSYTVINSDIVANTLTINGGGKIVSKPITDLGNLNISVAKIVE